MNEGSAEESIGCFMELVFSSAQLELRKVDAAYVRTIQSKLTLEKVGMVTPEIHPTHTLPNAWYKLLEAVVDLTWQADLLKFAARYWAAAFRDDKTDSDAGRRRDYAYTNWIHQAYALYKKTEVTIDLIAKIYRKGKHAEAIKRKYRGLVQKQVAGRIDQIRSPLAHGAGGRGMIAAAITKEKLWELLVCLPFPADMVVEAYHKERPPRLSAQPDRIKEVTTEVERRLGKILVALYKELMARTTSSPYRATS